MSCPIRTLTPLAQDILRKTQQHHREYYATPTNPPIHSHPSGTPYPSDIDITTTQRLGKKNLCIVRVPQREVVCYNLTKIGATRDSDLIAGKTVCRWKL